MPPKDARKDPNKPKGRMSAYAYFLKHKREGYRKQGVEVQFTSFSKECSEDWKKMGADNREDYIKLAEKDKLRYEREMMLYEPPPGYNRKGKKENGGKKKRRKREKDPNMPKRAMSAFFWFAGDKRPKLKEQNPGATVGEIAKQLGAAWKIMTEEQKEPYADSAKEDRVRYDKDMKIFRTKKAAPPPPPQEEYEEEEDEEEDGVSDEEED